MSRTTVSPTGVVTLATVASRVTGLLRVIVVAVVLGTTFLGNTYQSANVVSNVAFELLAAGMLSTALVPAFVVLFDEGRRAEAEQLAGSILGLALGVLAVVVAVAVVIRPWIMRALTIGVADPAVRGDQVRLGSSLLLLFLPQILLYAVGAVASALAAADRRFGAAGVAPVANNIGVIMTMGAFWFVSRGTSDLSPRPLAVLVLGAGTTLGVAAMTAIPLVGLRRAGLRLRPRWPGSGTIRSQTVAAGGWAAVHLGALQVLLVVTLIAANRVAGGVVAYNLAFTLFLLPFAVVAYPVVTTLYPPMSSAAQEPSRFTALVAWGIRTIVVRVAPFAALVVVLAEPGLAIIRLGALDSAGIQQASRALGAYGLGLVSYCVYHLAVRAAFAADRSKLAAQVTAAVAGAAALAMTAATIVLPDLDPLIGTGLAHSVALTAGAAALIMMLKPGPLRIAGILARAAAAAVVAGAAGWLVSRAVMDAAGTGRPALILAVVAGGLVGVGTYVAALALMGGPELDRRDWSPPVVGTKL